jgi:hypothetical protein
MNTDPRSLGVMLGVMLACQAHAQEPALVNTLANSRTELSSFLNSLSAVRGSERVEALPVKMVGVGLSAEILVEELPTVLAPSVGAKLASTLLNINSYEGGMSACLFNPAVAFRFRQGTKAIQALVCFQCSELIFEEPGGRALSGKMRLGKGRPVLLAEAKRAFPQNRELQALKK